MRYLAGLFIVVSTLVALGAPALADSAPQYVVRWAPPSHVRDQGADPDCVAAAWDNWLETAPHALDAVAWSDWQLYRAAQQVDEWEGDDYEGTSVEAGAKVLQEAGLISDVRFTQSFEEANDFLLHEGPVVVEGAWYSFAVDDAFHVLYGRTIIGFHAWECVAIMDNGDWECVNSWGSDWANAGHFYASPRFFAQEALFGGYYALAHKAVPLIIAGGSGARAV